MKPRVGRPTMTLQDATTSASAQDEAVPSINLSNCGKELQLRAHFFRDGELYVGGRSISSITRKDLDMEHAVQIGRGASATVYRVNLRTTGEPIALKCIPITTKSHRDEIDAELHLLEKGVVHRHVLQHFAALYDADVHNVEIIMEYMDYSVQDVAKFLNGLASHEQLLSAIAFQFALGLAFLHERRLLHRDLKPSNVLVNAQGVVKIGDFGIAKVVSTLGILSSHIGTEIYMAPERLETSVYGFASDIWSFGLTIVSMAKGGSPWEEAADGMASPQQQQPQPQRSPPPNLFERIQRVHAGDVPKLPQRMSADAQNFVSRCLVADPDQRASAAELLQHPFIASQTPETSEATIRDAVGIVTQWVKRSTTATVAELTAPMRLPQTLSIDMVLSPPQHAPSI